MASTLIKVDQGTIDRTAGYGNTQDSHNATNNRIADNRICNSDLELVLYLILTARFNGELVSAVGKVEWGTVDYSPNFTDTHSVTSNEMNEALSAVILSWAKHAGEYYRGLQTACGVLNGLLFGPLERCIPAVQGWVAEMTPACMKVVGSKKGKKRAA